MKKKTLKHHRQMSRTFAANLSLVGSDFTEAGIRRDANDRELRAKNYYGRSAASGRLRVHRFP